jgi:hypothetical protein
MGVAAALNVAPVTHVPITAPFENDCGPLDSCTRFAPAGREMVRVPEAAVQMLELWNAPSTSTEILANPP